MWFAIGGNVRVSRTARTVTAVIADIRRVLAVCGLIAARYALVTWNVRTW